MTSIKHSNIWKLLTDYDLKFTTELCDDFICTICKSILKNPYQSPCGCRYCLKCISNYLNGEEKHCPGHMEDCKDQTLNFEKDLQIDYIINKKISLISVFCPEESCTFSDELRNMEQHIKSHVTKCPFSSIGCESSEDLVVNLSNHLSRGNYKHSQLLINAVINLKSEVSSLKDSLLLANENKERQNEQIIDLENRLNDIRALENQKLLLYRDENKKLSKELESLIVTLELNEEGINKTKLKNLAKRFLENMKILTENIDKTTENPETEYLPFDENDLEGETIDLNVCTNDLLPDFFAPYSWRITDFNSKLQQAKINPSNFLLSEPFYSHLKGYKLCLTVHPNGTGCGKSTHLSVFCHIMKGKYDNDLNWPMKMEVRLCLTDQYYGNLCCDKKYRYGTTCEIKQYAFNKPSAVKNIGFGDPRMIAVDELLKNSRLYKNDSINIKCFVTN